jgi:hypothetical protein
LANLQLFHGYHASDWPECLDDILVGLADKKAFLKQVNVYCRPGSMVRLGSLPEALPKTALKLGPKLVLCNYLVSLKSCSFGANTNEYHVLKATSRSALDFIIHSIEYSHGLIIG